MARRKNRAAVSLAKLRAKKLSSERKKQIASQGGFARSTKLTPEQLSSISSKAGKAGGKARAEKLSAEERREIARKAAEARWGKKKPGKP